MGEAARKLFEMAMALRESYEELDRGELLAADQVIAALRSVTDER